MSLNLLSTDLVQVNPISSRNILQILPISAKKKRQTFVIGDDSGTLSCYLMKKGEPQLVFKSNPLGGLVTCVQTGYGKGGADKVFASCGQKVLGYTRKGKDFFQFESNLTENINKIVVSDNKIWTATDYIYNKFENSVDKDFFMCQDRINDMTIGNCTGGSEMNAILACQDRYIRVMQESDVVLKKTVSGPVLSVSTFESEKNDSIVYGTLSGAIGQLIPHSTKLKSGWKVSSEGSSSSINCISSYDIDKDGVAELLIGKDDGKMEVYRCGNTSEISKEYEYVNAESIRGVQGGIVSTPGFDEVIACTYSGRVVSFTTEPLDQPDKEDSYGRTRGTVQREGRILKLRKDITALEEKVAKEKDKVPKGNGKFVAPREELPINYKFVLNSKEAAYDLNIEIPAPIDIICLYSGVPVDLLDAEKNQAIASITKPDPLSKSNLLATYRCQEVTSRIELRLRTLEGQFGDIEVIVIAKLSPKKAQMIRCEIKPLSLHYRLNATSENDKPEQYNSLVFTGGFSLSQMHEWVLKCIPEVPIRLQDEEVKMSFRNAFTGSTLKCFYKKGDAEFMSDSVSTIAILKEVITKEATARKVTINMNFDIVKETIPAFLNLLRDKLDKKHALVSQVKLIEAIKEIQMQDSQYESWMSPEYQTVLNDSSRIMEDYKNRPRALEYIAGIITDVYVDYNKFRGKNVKQEIPKLHQLLENYNYDDLLDFFSAS